MKFKKYDTSSCHCIVFDEMLLYNPRQLYSIQMYMEQNNDKRYLCTGDIDQRKPFNFGCNNVDNQNEYQLLCVNQMFPDQITLRINKRLKHDEDKVKLLRLKEDILDITKNPIETFKKHGIKIINKIKDVDTTNNICLFNFRCDEVNKHISKNIIKKDGFYTGMEVVCKSHYKSKNIRLYVNYYDTIKSIKKNEIIIKNLNFVAGMTRRFVSAKRLIRYFSNSSKLVEHRARSPVREVKMLAVWPSIAEGFPTASSHKLASCI